MKLLSDTTHIVSTKKFKKSISEEILKKLEEIKL